MDEIIYVNNISVEDYNMLRLAVGWYEIRADKARVCIDNSAFIVAARCGDKTVGMTRALSDKGYVVYVADVIVLPGYQGRGIGRSMMRMVMDYIDTIIEDDAQVYSCLMAAKGKEAFYNKFGFITRPDDEVGAGMSQWIRKNRELTK